MPSQSCYLAQAAEELAEGGQMVEDIDSRNLPRLVADLQRLQRNPQNRAELLESRRVKNSLANIVLVTIQRRFALAQLFSSDCIEFQWAATARVVLGLGTMAEPQAAWGFIQTCAKNAVAARLRELSRERRTVPVDPTAADTDGDCGPTLLPWDREQLAGQADNLATAAIADNQARDEIAEVLPSLSPNYQRILQRLVVDEAAPNTVADERHAEMVAMDNDHGEGVVGTCPTCRNWVDANFMRAKAAVARRVNATLTAKGAH